MCTAVSLHGLGHYTCGEESAVFCAYFDTKDLLVRIFWCSPRGVQLQLYMGLCMLCLVGIHMISLVDRY